MKSKADIVQRRDTLPSVPLRSATYGMSHIEQADVLGRYAHWPKATVIISDGAYGAGGFPGDPPTVDGLASWCAPHVAEWSRHALPETTLWFWGTEIGWATVHLSKTNEACGVKNAATRKYFTQDRLWYFPPPEMMERLAVYANQHGLTTNRPYFSLDGIQPLNAEQWSRMRAKWNHIHGVTNVWSEPPIRGVERLKKRAAHSPCLQAGVSRPCILWYTMLS